MQEISPGFDIQVTSQVIHARIQGKWGGAINLSYLSEMTVKMIEVRALPWAIFIDARQCYFTEQMFLEDIRHNSAMDRRNQLTECWLLREPDQLSFLSHFLHEKDIPLGRFTQIDEAQNWLGKKGFKIDMTWFAKEII